jgi:hypothetical protein
MGSIVTKRRTFVILNGKRCKKHRTRRQRGGGGAASKPKYIAPPIAPKRIALFDLDNTLLFRTEVYGVWDLQEKRKRAGLAAANETIEITSEKVRPRPDILFPKTQEIVYIRPGALDALDLARTRVGPENVHIFTASSRPEYVMAPTGIASKINTIFDRIWTEPAMEHGSFIARKDIAAVRKSLELKPTDIVYLFDDKPEWVKNTSVNDHIVPVPAFIPVYELYGVSKTHNIVPDTIPYETTLIDIVRAKLT